MAITLLTGNITHAHLLSNLELQMEENSQHPHAKSQTVSIICTPGRLSFQQILANQAYKLLDESYTVPSSSPCSSFTPLSEGWVTKREVALLPKGINFKTIEKMIANSA